MALTRNGQLLIDGLELFGVQDGISAVIFILLKGDEKKMRLMEYMVEHQNATQDELLQKAREIAGTE